MGLFNKLFRNDKDLNFLPTADSMDEDVFWKIIRSSYKKAGGNFEGQLQALRGKLKDLSPQEIILFDNTFRKLRGEAYDWKLWGAIYIVNGGCSDDSFLDFREWIIAQGKEYYYTLTSDPECLANAPKSSLGNTWEGMGYIAAEVFKAMTQQDMPEGLKENQEIKGVRWSEKGDDLRNMLPKVWAKYHPVNEDTPMHIDREPAPGI